MSVFVDAVGALGDAPWEYAALTAALAATLAVAELRYLTRNPLFVPPTDGLPEWHWGWNKDDN